MAAGIKATGSLANLTFVESPSNTSDDLLYLDRNENAYGPTPKVIEAIRRAASSANRYARSERDTLQDTIAQLHRVGRDQVLLGAGSTDLLRMAAQVCLSSQQSLVVPDPTFGAAEYYAAAVKARVLKVPLTREYAIDLAAIRARISRDTGLLYLCNPNNPTGTVIPKKAIQQFVAGLPPTTAVVVDEAYHEYAASAAGVYGSLLDGTPLASNRLLVLRTFSKAYGIAGLRLGYAVGNPKMLERMGAFAAENNINSIAVQAGLAAVDSQETLLECARRNDDDRQEFFNQANGRMLRLIDSHANFAFMDSMRPADTVIQHFHQNKIRIGPQFRATPNYVRISFGTLEDMSEFWRVWDLLPKIDSPM